MRGSATIPQCDGREQVAKRRRDVFVCCFYGFGIIASLLVYGILSERIMTLEYSGELFETSLFLVFCNRAVATVFALTLAIVNDESLYPQAPLARYFIVSFANVYASACQYEALKYVTFSVQILTKSFRMLPVMLWGRIVSRKRYRHSDWGFAFVVTWGVTLFLVTGPIEVDASANTHKAILGVILLLVFLAIDGLTSTMQEQLFCEYDLSKYNQMLYVNLCSATISLVTLSFSGSLQAALIFCVQHHTFTRDVISLSSAAVIGQWFIYSQIQEFGALIFAATMNLRQLASIVVSNKAFEHPITIGQGISLLLVFGALCSRSYVGLCWNVGHLSEATPLSTDRSDLETPKTAPSTVGTEKNFLGSCTDSGRRGCAM